jgi:histidine triad (HIT) family protein
MGMQLSPEQQKAIDEQKEQCIFCKIIKGEMDSKKVFEDELFMGILDINPATKGHVLLMPKEHYPIMPLIPQETLNKLYLVVRDVSNAVKQALVTVGSTVMIANGAAAGQQSTHFMLHVIPRDRGDGLSHFDIPKNEITEGYDKAFNDLKNNLGIMLKGGKGKAVGGVPGNVSKEQLLKIIEQNPQLKQVILHQPDELKKALPQNEQLKSLFADKDVDEIIAEVRKKEGLPEKAETEEKGKDAPVEAEFTEEKEEGKTEPEKEREEPKEEKEEPEEEATEKEEEQGEDPRPEAQEPQPEEDSEESKKLDDIASLFK